MRHSRVIALLRQCLYGLDLKNLHPHLGVACANHAKAFVCQQEHENRILRTHDKVEMHTKPMVCAQTVTRWSFREHFRFFFVQRLGGVSPLKTRFRKHHWSCQICKMCYPYNAIVLIWVVMCCQHRNSFPICVSIKSCIPWPNAFKSWKLIHAFGTPYLPTRLPNTNSPPKLFWCPHTNYSSKTTWFAQFQLILGHKMGLESWGFFSWNAFAFWKRLCQWEVWFLSLRTMPT